MRTPESGFADAQLLEKSAPKTKGSSLHYGPGMSPAKRAYLRSNYGARSPEGAIPWTGPFDQKRKAALTHK